MKIGHTSGVWVRCSFNGHIICNNGTVIVYIFKVDDINNPTLKLCTNACKILPIEHFFKMHQILFNALKYLIFNSRTIHLRALEFGGYGETDKLIRVPVFIEDAQIADWNAELAKFIAFQ